MAKKSDKYSGMGDMFVQLEIDEKTAAFNTARKNLELQIKALEGSSSDYDSGLSSVEDRNEINDLRNEIIRLERQYNQEIESIKSKTK